MWIEMSKAVVITDMDENDNLWSDTLLNHIQKQEIIYGWLNIEENKQLLLKDKGVDDIIYLFYINAIDLYLAALTDEEKGKRGMNG